MKVYIDIHDKRWKKYKIDFAQIANAVVGAKYKNGKIITVNAPRPSQLDKASLKALLK